MSTVEEFQSYHGLLTRNLQKICDYKHDVAEVDGELVKVKNVCETCKTALETFSDSRSSEQIEQLHQNIKDAKSQWTSKVGTAEMTYVREDRGYYVLKPGAKNKVIYEVTTELGKCSDWLNKMKHCLMTIKEMSLPPQAHIQTLLLRMKTLV
jgi:hypothetical protein